MGSEVVEKQKGFGPVQQRLMEFIRREFRPGYNHYNVSKLIGDASARQYFRYVPQEGDSYILAVYPEPFEVESFAYHQIYQLFREIGLRVPRIRALDGRLGIVLQQDLGDTTLQKYFLAAPAGEKERRLREGIDCIVRIQLEGSPRLPPEAAGYSLAFDEEKLAWELGFFRRHYLENYRGLEADTALEEDFRLLARQLAGGRRWLCHRDFHVRNLMLNRGRLYLIDFQDARWGPQSYDLVSLLEDSIELEGREIEALVDYYLQQFGYEGDREAFLRQFHRMAVQRLLKALGTYAYQIGVRENFLYEQYMTGSLHRAQLSLEQLGDYPAIRRMVEAELAGANR